MFSEELERARDEHEGTGLEAARLAEVREGRRTARRASFGGAEDGDARSAEPRARASEPESTLAPPVTAAGPVRAQPDEACPACAPEEAPLAQASAPGSAAEGPEPAPLPAAQAPGNAASAELAAVLARVAAESPVAANALPPGPSAPTQEPAPLAATPLRSASAKPAASAQAQAPAGHATLARAEEILRQVELHLAAGVKRLAIELEPADLGRLSIQLALRGGKVAAIVRGERAETLELLRSREAELKRLLAERGVVTDGVRFELGFRTPSEARQARPSTSSGSERSARAGAGPVSFDSYA